jgi:hypothetical protein
MGASLKAQAEPPRQHVIKNDISAVEIFSLRIIVSSQITKIISRICCQMPAILKELYGKTAKSR